MPRRQTHKISDDYKPQVRVLVHEALYNRLMAYCAAKETTRSIVTRKALHQFLLKEGFRGDDIDD